MAKHSLSGTSGGELFGPFAYSSDDYVIDGRGGDDTVEASATSGRDYVNLSRDGATARLAITPQGAVDDSIFNLTSVEHVVIRAGAGLDVVDIGDISGLGVKRVTVDLSAPAGGSDRAVDVVSADGTAGADSVRIVAVDGTVTVTGLPAQLVITGADPTLDRLEVHGGLGNDILDASGVFGLMPNAKGFFLFGDEGADKLIGSSGSDQLAGGAGADTLIGGVGNDVYVNPTGDTIVEAAGQGIDTVISGASFSLAGIANVERLTLFGTADINGTGNELDNVIVGTTGRNIINGLAGNDTIQAGDGADTINGGDGVDILVGGLGSDIINPGNDNLFDIVRFIHAAESTSSGRDVVIGMNLAGEDVFDLPFMPTSVSPNVTGGALNEATFDADLRAAVNASLPVGGAVLFDPSSGTADHAGSAYLVVDANGIAGYQAGADYVIELQNFNGKLDLSDFI